MWMSCQKLSMKWATSESWSLLFSLAILHCALACSLVKAWVISAVPELKMARLSELWPQLCKTSSSTSCSWLAMCLSVRSCRASLRSSKDAQSPVLNRRFNLFNVLTEFIFCSSCAFSHGVRKVRRACMQHPW